jgi:stearoyl-CoA desaturase (Delta-9 desaturase)
MTVTLEEVREPPRPAPVAEPPASEPFLTVHRFITAVLVVSPVLALGLAIGLMWGHGIHLFDVVLAIALYAITGYGITVGFHRMFTHRSFKAGRILKVVLGVAGSMAVQGSLTAWVANHRRHHVFSDQEGDPHSPNVPRDQGASRRQAFLHAHVGWLFGTDTTSTERFAPDMLADPLVVAMSRLFPVFAVASLALPFAIGWMWTGTLRGAFIAFALAGLVRMALLHHVTWSVNSICHLFGRRPFATNDRSRNFAPLAVLSFGESWHNFHHACPSSARHGAEAHQLDSSARLIRLFEWAGWATKVRWPTLDRVDTCRVG